MNRFDEKTYLITGASSGIGRELAISISNLGGRIILIGRDENRLRDTLDAMKNKEMHIPISFDLNELNRYNEIFSLIKKRGIVLNGLVHCAGIAPILPLRIMKYENSLEVFNIHYFAFVELVKNYSKKGIADGGSIVGVSAINAHVPQKCMTAYAAAKSAVESACRTLSLELIEKNIRINSVVLGGVDTGMAQKTDKILEGIETSYENTGNKQLISVAKPIDVVGPIMFLLSDDARYITGRELYADGGMF